MNNKTPFIYFVYLYYSILVISGNVLGPKETIELIYFVTINLMASIVKAYIFSGLADYADRQEGESLPARIRHC